MKRGVFCFNLAIWALNLTILSFNLSIWVSVVVTKEFANIANIFLNNRVVQFFRDV